MFRVSYCRIEGTELYEVRLFALGEEPIQQIVLHKKKLVDKIRMDPKTLVGCQDMPINAIIDLGFIFPVAISKKMVI